MRGLHLTADLYGCRCAPGWLTDATRLDRWSREATEAAGLQVEDGTFHAAGDGVSGALVMARSHLSVHTCAGQRSVVLDVFLSGSGPDGAALARGLMDVLVARFEPEWTEQRSLDRGDGQ